MHFILFCRREADFQDEIPAIDSNTVLTNTGTAGNIGTKQIYNPNTDYKTQQNALVTAETFNSAVQNAIDTEFVCVESIPAGCLLWKINQIITGKNLFDKGNPQMRMNAYFNSGTRFCISPYGGGDKVVFIPVKPDTTYTIQRTIPNQMYDRFRIGAFNTKDTPKASDCATDILFDAPDLTTRYATVTTKNDTTYLGVFCRNSGTVGPDWQEYLDTFQVEQGNTPTSYEPHHKIYMPTETN